MGIDARLEPLLRPQVIAPITSVLAYVLYYLELRTLDIPEISILNARKSESFPYFLALWMNTFNLKSALILHA